MEERTAFEFEKDADITSFSTIIKDFSLGMFDPDSPLPIKVRRSNVWWDALFMPKRCTEHDLNRLLKVLFIGEPAVDQGGPRKEFFPKLIDIWLHLLFLSVN